jgi:hypothetical protein
LMVFEGPCLKMMTPFQFSPENGLIFGDLSEKYG